MDNRKKRLAIAIFIFITSLLIGWLSSPLLISWYFGNQPIYSITESKSKLYTDTSGKPEKDSIMLGQSIVLYGYIDEDYILHNSDGSYQTLTPVIGKINCIPFEEGNYKIVGSYNLVNSDYNRPLPNIRTLFLDTIPISRNTIIIPDDISSKRLEFFVLWTLDDCNK